MKFLVFLVLGILEYILITFITGRLIKIKEYVTINYDVFSFVTMGERKCGLNILIKMIVPVIYTIICSGIFYKIGLNEYVQNVFILEILYFIIRWIFVVLIYDRRYLNDWKSEIITFFASTIIMLFIYFFLIIQTEELFVSVDELKNAIWVGCITYICIIIRDYIYNYAKVDESESKKRKIKYILSKYDYFKRRYGFIIDKEEENLQNLIYAIMIYENYNRPLLIRKMEYIKFFYNGEATLGVMQFQTKKIISDKESIEKGYNKIKQKYIEYSKEKMCIDELYNKVIFNYNNSIQYVGEVKYILEVIENKDYKINM